MRNTYATAMNRGESMGDASRRVVGAATVTVGVIGVLVILLIAASTVGPFSNPVVATLGFLPWYWACVKFVFASVALLLARDSRDKLGAALLRAASIAWTLVGAFLLCRALWRFTGHSVAPWLTSLGGALDYASFVLFALGALRSRVVSLWIPWTALGWVVVEVVHTHSWNWVMARLVARPDSDRVIPVYQYAAGQLTILLQVLYWCLWIAVGWSVLATTKRPESDNGGLLVRGEQAHRAGAVS